MELHIINFKDGIIRGFKSVCDIHTTNFGQIDIVFNNGEQKIEYYNPTWERLEIRD